MDADDGVQFGFVSPAGVASYITIAYNGVEHRGKGAALQRGTWE